MRKIRILIGTAILSASMSMVAFAGEWKHEPTGWWYQNDDKSYPVSCWKEIDGKQYYFDEKGWLLMNTTTPDGKQVDSSGALIQAQPVNSGSGFVAPPPTGDYWNSLTPEQQAELLAEAERLKDEYRAKQPKPSDHGVYIDPNQDFSSAARWSWK